MTATSPNDVLKIILDYENDNTYNFREWFLKQFNNVGDGNGGFCLEEFAEYFLNSLRQHTERHLKVNSGTDSPKCQTPVRTLKPKDDSLAATPRTTLQVDLQHQETSTPYKSVRGHENSQNSTGIRSEISLTSYGGGGEDYASFSTPFRLSTSADRSSSNSQRLDSSTPVKRNGSNNSARRLSTTPTSSATLGDFIIFNKSNPRSHKKKNNSSIQSSLNQSGQQPAHEKPKKRLQPINVSKKVEMSESNSTSVFAGESSFSNENNILKLSYTEVEDKEQCSILAARRILKTNAIAITKELTESPIKSSSNAIVASTPSQKPETVSELSDEPILQVENIQNNKILKRLGDIYVTLIDLSLATNTLNELSFLLNLLSASASSPTCSADLVNDFEQMELRDEEECSKSLSCLNDINCAIGFAILCLNQLKHLVGILDSKTLKVIINNGRFSYLKEDVRTFIINIYHKKLLVLAESNTHESSFCIADAKSSYTNVYFQEDKDSRQNFSSNHEFANFRAQRDLFYKCLQLWETNHLNPNWKFASEVGPIIREIFQQSEIFINMAHFANLFISQLMLSASNASTPEEIGIDVDMQKLNKLTQRLIAPSQFSVDYQFPRAQAFFRDFILRARSVAFAEQLKMTLYSELLSMNDSSFDYINITKTENETNNQHDDNSFIGNLAYDQVAVRPEILNSMLILAKFLGFTISLPYAFNTNNGNVLPPKVEEKQIKLRTLIQPNFDLHSVVLSAMEEGKLLITIPWMVQYISMLDSITLQLDVHRKVLKLLFALHWYLSRYGANTLPADSKFIITACLSWLFDSKQIISEQYYEFRLLQSTNPKEEVATDLIQIKSKLVKIVEEKKTQSQSDVLALNPILEALLPVACPFLGEFRVSIMPAKYASTKYASRSGRYRHITTRIAELSSPTSAAGGDGGNLVKTAADTTKASQKNLIQAFFHSQNASTRQLIAFCSERCFKSVVKDAQLNILLPCKSKADAEVNKINSNKFQIVYNEICKIYKDAHKEASDKWNNTVPKLLDARIKKGLDGLLPAETACILKKTYFMIIKNNAMHKISQWFYGNIIKDQYFCVDLKNIATKICTTDKTKPPSELRIVIDTPSVSELMSSLQYWLHVTSVRTELFHNSYPITEILQGFIESFKNVLPHMLYRLVASYTIQLMQNIINQNCDQLTDQLIETSCDLFHKVNTDLNLPGNSKDPSKHCIYGGLITVPFFQSLGYRSACYSKFGQLLICMITNDIISLDYANDLFVSILKHDWPPSQLNEISNLLRSIADATDDTDPEEDDEKSNLFMDMLADLSRDVEFF